MEKVIKLKYTVLIVLITTIANYNSEISSGFRYLIDLAITGNDLNNLKKFILLLFKLTSIGVLFALFSYLYDNFLWKFIFPKFNISGTWRYTNSYFDKRPNTVGKIKIKQTPYKITFIDGEHISDNKYPSRFVSTSVSFDEEHLILVASYVVYKYKEHDTSKFAKKRSVLKLKVVKHKKRAFKRAVTMVGEFYNCIQTPKEESQVINYELGDWPMTWGTAQYNYE